METCTHCGGPVTGRTKVPYCKAPACRRAYDAERQRQFKANWKATHGETYNRSLYGGQYAEVRRAYRERVGYTDSTQARDARRRARKKGVGAERFTNREVFDRDGWVCGICAEPVDRDLAYPDPMSVSLDHVTPLSLGGSHTRENTRCAHLSCNVQRGNRMTNLERVLLSDPTRPVSVTEIVEAWTADRRAS